MDITEKLVSINNFSGKRYRRRRKTVPFKRNLIFGGYHDRRSALNSILKYRQFAAKVTVKRIFRGNADLQGHMVVVAGLGNLNLCVSRPRIGDTRIFFVENLRFKDYKFGEIAVSHFHLRSSLLRPTLSNLKVLGRLDKNPRNTGKNKIDDTNRHSSVDYMY